MIKNISSSALLGQELISSAADLRAVVEAALRKANNNASRNIYLVRYETEALARTVDLSQLFAGGARRPPLYGVPISIKDCFDVKGSVTSCGSRYYAKVRPPAL